MSYENNAARKMSDDHGTPRDIELEMYDGLVAAGLVKPCININPADVEVPKDFLDPSRLLRRVKAEASADEGCSISAGITQGNSSLDKTNNYHCESLFPTESEEGEDGTNDGIENVISMPPPVAERLPALLAIVQQAFLDVRGQWSTDRIIADPELGDLFLRRCWELGAQASDYELNWTLLYGRKSGKFPELPRARRFSLPRERVDEFGFASEMAARHVQRQQWQLYGREVSLDRILCDPVLAAEFDALAAQIAPNHSVLEYRWAALALRKSQRSLPGGFRLRDDDFEDLGYTHEIRLASVPKAKGIYCFHHESRVLFVGHTEGLRRQMSIHFDTCGTRVIPAWMDDRELNVRLSVAPMAGSTPSRRGLARARQVAMHKPSFNWVSDLSVA